MTDKQKYNFLTALIAAVWLTNGLLCKVMGLVPRHEKIVAVILGHQHASLLTVLIGLAEVLMALWILSNFKSKINAVVQIIVVLTMNIIEFILVPQLLLWGRFNLLFALLFIAIVYYNEFILHKEKNSVSLK